MANLKTITMQCDKRHPGNIRSINVDYFGSSSEAKLEQTSDDLKSVGFVTKQEQQSEARLSRLHNYNKQRQQRQQDQQQQRQREHCQRGLKFAPLEAAILDSVAELLAADGNQSRLSGIHISQLIAHLSARFCNQMDPPGVEFVDCAINGLVRGARLRLSAMSQEEMRALLEAPDNGNSSSNSNSALLQSVFLDQLIAPGDEFADRTGERQAKGAYCSAASGSNASSTRNNRYSSWSQTGSLSQTTSASTSADEEQQRRVSRVSSASTTKSKSTTLDSGIQSWDLVSSPNYELENTENSTMRDEWQHREAHSELTVGQVVGHKPLGAVDLESANDCRVAMRRRFSLGRSFSFRPKKSSSLSHNQTNSNRWTSQQATEAADEQNNCKAQEPSANTCRVSPLTASNKISSNLSSLFRSRSMRAISSGRSGFLRRDDKREDCDFAPSRLTSVGNLRGERSPMELGASSRRQWQAKSAVERRQATIDYLSTAQPHKRSFSMRRNSLLAFNTKEDSSGGKIVLFLRRLFNLRRLQPEPVRAGRAVSGERSFNQHIVGPAVNEQWTSEQPRSRLPVASAQATYSQQANKLPNSKPNFSVSPSSNSSSGSSSLIEILDCSPAVNSSKRAFRSEERALSLNRATWRLVKRSDSSLSQNSEASSSTTKSTVSQQLRRHLDEAYKRHRNCTNKREKEFIDSINVLRQASRHALIQSPPRSSSKTRQSSRGTATSKSVADDTASSCGSATCTLAHRRPEEAPQLDDRLLSRQDAFRAGPESKWPLEACQRETNNNNHYKCAQHELDLIPADRKALYTSAFDSNRASGLPVAQRPSEPPSGLGCACSLEPLKRQAEPIEHDCNQVQNCCLCSSYLGPASPTLLCPLAYCPAGPLGGLCPLAGPHKAELGARSPLASPQLPVESGPASVSSPADFCCPLWRSMVYNYCQQPLYTGGGIPVAVPLQQHQPAASQPLHLAANDDEQQVVLGADQLGRRLGNFAASTQHQHNTTIDLKIEIGRPGDFDGEKSEAGIGRCRLVQLPDDSLDESDQTEESLSSNRNDNADNREGEPFERDSYASDTTRSDSLKASNDQAEARQQVV